MEDTRFVISNDSEANWAIRKIVEADRKLAELKDWYRKQTEAAAAEHDRDIAYFTGLLREYFAQVPAKETKTQSKYALPAGEMVMKKPKRDFMQADPDELLDWCRSNDESLVKTVQSPKWADIKARLVETDAGIIDRETGMKVDGVMAFDLPEEFKVRVKEDEYDGI